MSRENFIFAGGLTVIVGTLVLVCAWVVKSQPAENRETGRMKNPYLIAAPQDVVAATQPASQPVPAR